MSCNCEFCIPFIKAFGSKFEQAAIVSENILNGIDDKEEAEIILMALLLSYRVVSNDASDIVNQAFCLTALEHTQECLKHEFEPEKGNNLLRQLNIKGSLQ